MDYTTDTITAAEGLDYTGNRKIAGEECFSRGNGQESARQKGKTNRQNHGTIWRRAVIE